VSSDEKTASGFLAGLARQRPHSGGSVRDALRASPAIKTKIDFKIEIVPTDGTNAAILRKRGLRYVAAFFGQQSATVLCEAV